MLKDRAQLNMNFQGRESGTKYIIAPFIHFEAYLNEYDKKL